MKKKLLFLLPFLAIALLSSCGNKETPSNQTNQGGNPGTQTGTDDSKEDSEAELVSEDEFLMDA